MSPLEQHVHKGDVQDQFMEEREPIHQLLAGKTSQTNHDLEELGMWDRLAWRCETLDLDIARFPGD